MKLTTRTCMVDAIAMGRSLLPLPLAHIRVLSQNIAKKSDVIFNKPVSEVRESVALG